MAYYPPANPHHDKFTSLLGDLDLPRIPQQARSRAKRDAIVEAAAHLFARHGYDETTTTDIAAQAGVSVGTVYSYFRDKRQIFVSLYAGTLESTQALKIAEMDLDHPRQSILYFLDRALPYDPQNYALQRAWTGLCLKDPEMAALGDQINQVVYHQFAAWVHRAAGRFLTRPDLDIDTTCWLISRMLDQAWHTWLGPYETSQEEYQRHLAALAGIIYHAIFKTRSI